MPFDTIFGLPVHVLVNHAAVVLVPLAALATAVIAVVGKWRARYGPAVLGLAILCVPLVFVTIESGERLQARLGSSPDIARHQALGETMLWFSLALAVVTGVLVLRDRMTRLRQTADIVLRVTAVVAVLVAVATFVQVTRTGHVGSEAVWKGVVDATNP
ncbi:MAG: hypothetical protein H0W56_04390 [Acidothermales bacterium]|jgi:hypothetical protein|nr:hypothetical protein [Acidothermales bacterium]